MAIFLVFCMLASSMPLLAYAAEGTEADQAQQITEEKQEGTETQPSQEQTKTAEEAVKDVAEKAVSENAGEAGTGQEADNAGTSEQQTAPPLRAAANDAAEADDGQIHEEPRRRKEKCERVFLRWRASGSILLQRAERSRHALDESDNQ